MQHESVNKLWTGDNGGNLRCWDVLPAEIEPEDTSEKLFIDEMFCIFLQNLLVCFLPLWTLADAVSYNFPHKCKEWERDHRNLTSFFHNGSAEDFFAYRKVQTCILWMC